LLRHLDGHFVALLARVLVAPRVVMVVAAVPTGAKGYVKVPI
jgi:hypothetical protein